MVGMHRQLAHPFDIGCNNLKAALERSLLERFEGLFWYHLETDIGESLEASLEDSLQT